LDDFPARLRELREQKRLSRRVLSDLCGLHHDAIRKYERGEVKPTMDALISLADHFNVSLDYLTCRTDHK